MSFWPQWLWSQSSSAVLSPMSHPFHYMTISVNCICLECMMSCAAVTLYVLSERYGRPVTVMHIAVAVERNF